MASSFEFLSRSDRCPRKPVKSFVLFVILFLGLGAQVWSLKRQIRMEQERLEAMQVEITRETQQLMERAKKTVPPATEVATIRKRIETHNKSLIGPRSSFIRLFTMLEEWLPDGAATIQVESIRGGRPAPILVPEDRLFRLTVIFNDFPTISSFYRRLAQSKNVSGLFFQRKGRKDWQGRSGEAVEFTFRLENL